MNANAPLVPPPADAAGLVRPNCDLCGCYEQLIDYRLTVGHLVRCPNCDLTYVSPRLPTAQLQRKLQAWAKQDVVDEERLRIAFAPRTQELYAQYLTLAATGLSSGGRRAIDIGCSTGAFMQVARRHGWQIDGIEIGEASASYARQALDLNVHCGSLFDSAISPDSIDLIAFLEVIEHLESPTAALRRIAGWLRPGGVLLLSTPNYDSLFRRLLGTRWWVVNCEDEHIVLFARRTLERALRAAGLEPFACRIRGLDIAGMASVLTSCRVASPAGGNAPPTHGYHHARSRKEAIKRFLAAAGFINLARSGIERVEARFADRDSLFHAWGEQLVVLARKPPA